MTDPVLPPIVGKAFEAAAKGAFAHLMRERLERARSVLARRLAKGQYWAVAEDDAAAALFTYLRAAEEGAARRNLELMADYLVNAAADPDFAPNEFRRHAKHLADLSRAEALALAIMTKAGHLGGEGGPWIPVVQHALDSGYFRDEGDFIAACIGLTRTGWVRPLSLWGTIGYGPTSALEDVARLIDVEGAVRRAEAEGVER